MRASHFDSFGTSALNSSARVCGASRSCKVMLWLLSVRTTNRLAPGLARVPLNSGSSRQIARMRMPRTLISGASQRTHGSAGARQYPQARSSSRAMTIGAATASHWLAPHTRVGGFIYGPRCCRCRFARSSVALDQHTAAGLLHDPTAPAPRASRAAEALHSPPDANPEAAESPYLRRCPSSAPASAARSRHESHAHAREFAPPRHADAGRSPFLRHLLDGLTSCGNHPRREAHDCRPAR